MKKILHPLLKLSWTTALLVAVSGFAALVPTEWRHRQEFTVDAPGLVRVELTDATFDAAQPNLEDLRLLDQAGREVSYLRDLQPVHPPPEVPTDGRVGLVAPRSFRTIRTTDATQLLVETGLAGDLESLVLETTAPLFLKAVHLEVSANGQAWTSLGASQPVFRQFGAQKLHLPLGGRKAAFVRATVDDSSSRPVDFSAVHLRIGPPVARPRPAQPAGARIVRQEEFSTETVFTLSLDARNLPLSGIRLQTDDPLFMRHVTVSVRMLLGDSSIERIVGSGSIHRVKLTGSEPHAELHVPVPFKPTERELLVRVHHGDSPPLKVNGIQVERPPVGLLFHAAASGRYTLLSGNPRATAPRYDLAALAGNLRQAPAPTVSPGPLHDNPGHAPGPALDEPLLREIALTGAALDPTGWTRRKPVEISAPGVQELELDPAALAGSRSDFADLRLVRAGHQIPYLLERTGLARALTLPLEPDADPKRPTFSIWKLKLPHAGLPLPRLALTSDTALFERRFRIYEKLTAADGRSHDHTLASGDWSRPPEPGSPRTHGFDLSARLQTDTLYLETDNGDNPPIVLADVKAEYAVVRLVFKTAGTDGFQLLYGNPGATSPRYDLGLVSRRLLTAERTPARLGPEETDPEGFARGVLRHLRGGVAFWGALSLVVVVLLVIVARLLPKAEPPK